MKPDDQSPLPWEYNDFFRTIEAANGEEVARGVMPVQDGEYIVHACNAYPELVAENERLKTDLRFLVKEHQTALRLFSETLESVRRGQEVVKPAPDISAGSRPD